MQQAEWIWKENENAADTWLCFVRDIGLNRKPGKVTARIAVDSKYWLYINGKLAGVTAPEQEKALTRLLTETENASPYMEKTVLDALCEMNRTEEALARIRKRYTPMMEDSYSTLWEFWDRNAGTLNHAWTGGPLITMERYVAGVIPVDSLTYRIQPHPCFLRFIDCTVPTVRGPLRVQITTEGNKKEILIGHPAGIRVIPEVPDSWEKICIG